MLKNLVAVLSLGWVTLLATGRFHEIGEALVALAIACVVPLGVQLSRGASAASPDRSFDWFGGAVSGGATLGLASFALSKGVLAGALAVGWAAASVCIALSGARRIARRGFGPTSELAIDVSHLYLPVGATWLVASRADVPLLGFYEPIVLYTAAHFHFAGFAAPLVAGMLGRELGRNQPGPALRRLHTLATAIVIAGVPLVAAGIQLSRRLEMPAAIILGSGMFVIASLLVLAGARRLADRKTLFQADTGSGRVGHVPADVASGGLLIAAGLSLVFSMGLAILFTTTGSATRGSEAPLIPYSTMATLHGVANAGGFALLAMCAFSLDTPRAQSELHDGDWPRLFGVGAIGIDFFERKNAIAETRLVTGQIASLDAFAHAGFDPAKVDPAVRDFYESTANYELLVVPEWHVPFRLGGRLFAWIARHVLRQLELPTQPEGHEAVTTRLFGVRDELDGRTDVRGYVRSYGQGSAARANYVAAYSTWQAEDRLLLSASFPLPFAALVALLRFENGPMPGGLFLSSHGRDRDSAPDEGMFLATGLGPLRLPVHERIEVWRSPDGEVQASHVTWLLGLRCFTLRYTIVERSSAEEPGR